METREITKWNSSEYFYQNINKVAIENRMYVGQPKFEPNGKLERSNSYKRRNFNDVFLTEDTKGDTEIQR